MHHTIKGYILADESAKNGFAEAIKDGPFNISVLDLGGSWLIPEQVKWLGELYFNAVKQYTNDLLAEYDNDYDILGGNIKYFTGL
jgi:hypothetical protein